VKLIAQKSNHPSSLFDEKERKTTGGGGKLEMGNQGNDRIGVPGWGETRKISVSGDVKPPFHQREEVWDP